MASTRQLEKTGSEELRRLRAEMEAFTFDKQNWAVQSTAMQKRIAELEQELARSQDYTEELEICCGKVGLPVSAIRQAGSAVARGDAQDDSDEEEVLSLYSKPRRQTVSLEEGPATPRRSAGPTPELRDVWQIVLLTIPEELKSQLSEELRTGTIMVKEEEDEDSDVYDRLKAALLRLRGPTHAAWHKILDIKQAPKEAFEVYAERMWVSFKEHSGVENANRDQEVILQLLKNNAGSYIQQALANGADPPENTFRSLVDWASKIEVAKQGKLRAIAATQWVAEGKGGASPQESGTSPRLGCPFCT
ncbi:hypothetical protein SKAU_G00130870 [Synaphobranchus kaupii]|uniref:Uncharacterized protein n=1 Tax=Synaphobranchus kaupii TaxID=118154 RepID=A0A9Q1FQD5_SYNKA|nr:hypothetical protein SKAU_G00130870 [Synaphobranchus kaupii]